MVMAANVIRRPINVWRINELGQLEMIVTYGQEFGGVDDTRAINLLWHQAGHYGEQIGQDPVLCCNTRG